MVKNRKKGKKRKKKRNKQEKKKMDVARAWIGNKGLGGERNEHEWWGNRKSEDSIKQMLEMLINGNCKEGRNRLIQYEKMESEIISAGRIFNETVSIYWLSFMPLKWQNQNLFQSSFLNAYKNPYNSTIQPSLNNGEGSEGQQLKNVLRYFFPTKQKTWKVNRKKGNRTAGKINCKEKS